MFRVPFSTNDFFAVFTSYNEAVWPAQLLLLGAAVAAVTAAVLRGARLRRWVWAILAFLWVWTGVAYHLLHFSRINPAAIGFGALFVLQGLLLLWRGAARGDLGFRAELDASGLAAGAILTYALVIYPLIGLLTGHALVASPTFGAPCPMVIFTFGMLLLAPGAPAWLYAIPVAWSVLGISAITLFGVVQDIGLPISALVAVVLLIRRRRLPEQGDVARA